MINVRYKHGEKIKASEMLIIDDQGGDATSVHGANIYREREVSYGKYFVPKHFKI